MVYQHLDQIDFKRDDLPQMILPGRVLLTTPMHFAVEYVINPHMEGNIGEVDLRKAISQWNALQDAYNSVGIRVHLVHGYEDLPDMVFCANQTLPFTRDDFRDRGVILSSMNSPFRQPEVPFYQDFFSREDYEIVTLPEHITDFEGMGDAIWHPNRRLLWGGYGFRSSIQAYEFISDAIDVAVAVVELKDPEFYHLDTCLSVLNESTCLIFPGAFQDSALEMIHHFFDTVLEAPEDESRNLFAVNAHCPDGRHVFIQEGCERTNELLANAGFLPVTLNTDEFLKSGGSVFCMKQMFW